MKTWILPLALLVLAACKGKPAERGLIDAYAPVYSPRATALTISSTTPQPFVNGGKIATVGNTLYQVEQDKGIHIINISNPALPVKTGFINVALCRELTLKGSYLYTNNMNDLVVLNVSNPTNVTESNRIANAFPDLGVQFPPEAEPGDYFECADASKGVVIRWELTKINNPQCRK
jgi:LVIVD repeat